ncbi:rhamnogalacturonan acetylesterase [Sphingomonas sp. FW199]|uniref:rhamnogalacturonan acetylesterase n=1 Tax=Sphingomonas sp. FW199 TaxID=3400217 RepID=UPI003CF0FBD7
MLSVLIAAAALGQTVFIASDSTASNYPDRSYPQTGWGQMLPCALDGVKVENRAIGGRSTRTFISEGRWEKLIADIQPGDTVLIQFGHNDASRNRPERYAAAATDYRVNLTRFVADVRARGGTPVLLTPVARRSFNPDGTAKADYADYASVAKIVAQETGTVLLDLGKLSRDWLTRTGAEKAKPFFLHYTPQDGQPAYPKGISDDTHFSELGARHVADLVAGELVRLNLPVGKAVRADRSGLTIDTAAGNRDCTPAR